MIAEPAEIESVNLTRSQIKWRRPAIWIALWFGLGILLHGATPTCAELYCAIAALTSLFAILFASLRIMALTLLAASLIGAGIAAAQIQHYYVSGSDLRQFLGKDELLARIKVKIVEPGTLKHTGDQVVWATRCEMEEIESKGQWRKTTGKTILRIANESQGYRPGQELSVVGLIKRIDEASNPGGFDWQSHFARENIFCRIHVAEAGTVRVVGDSGEGWLWSSRRFVRESLSMGFTADQQHPRAVLQALLFGDNDELLEQTWSDFRASGTAHHLSVSGMHIATLSAAVYVVIRLLRLHPRNALIIAIIFAIIYASMTRPSPPVIRSILLCIAVGTAMLTSRNTDSLQCLGVAAVIMMVISPMDLLSPGFQLSFLTVAGLMIYSTPLNQWFWSWENKHVSIARTIRPPTGLAAARHRLKQAITVAISAGMVAYAFSMPLIAWHFGQINPWAIPGSILLAFVVEASLIIGMVKVIVCAIIPATAGVAALISAIPIAWMSSSVAFLASLPGAQVALPPFPWWLLPVYAILLLAPLLWKGSRVTRFLPLIGLLGFVIFIIVGWFIPNGQNVTITFLSVGNGACAIVQMPDRCAIVDCGALEQPDLFQQTILPALRTLGARRIDELLITHEDMDHRSAANDITAAFKPAVRRCMSRGTPAGSWFEIIAPTAWGKGNNESAVIRMTAFGRSILFTGDIQQEGITNLLRSGIDLKTDILVAPHHGSAEEATSEFLSRTNPIWIIGSSGIHESGKQLRFNQLAIPARLLRTSSAGAITVKISPTGNIHVNTYR